MKRIFLLILFLIISNKAIASIECEVLICNKDTIGYNFISNDKVEISGLNLNVQHIFSVNHSYEVAENSILILQPLLILNKEKDSKSRPVGWIFRRTLDYVSLEYANSDWSRKFLWNCEITSLNQLKIRMKIKLNKLIKVNGKKK